MVFGAVVQEKMQCFDGEAFGMLGPCTQNLRSPPRNIVFQGFRGEPRRILGGPPSSPDTTKTPMPRLYRKLERAQAAPGPLLSTVMLLAIIVTTTWLRTGVAHDIVRPLSNVAEIPASPARSGVKLIAGQVRG